MNDVIDVFNNNEFLFNSILNFQIYKLLIV